MNPQALLVHEWFTVSLVGLPSRRYTRGTNHPSHLNDKQYLKVRKHHLLDYRAMLPNASLVHVAKFFKHKYGISVMIRLDIMIEMENHSNIYIYLGA